MKKYIITLMMLGIFGLYAGAAYAELSDTVNVTATIGAGTSSVSIGESLINFATVTPTDADHRFSKPMTVSYFAAGFPWAVRVYTDNVLAAEPAATAAEKAGLRGADGITYLPMKVWCSNFGPGTTMPDPELDSNYIGKDLDGNGKYNDVLTSGSYVEATVISGGLDINGDGDTLDTITATALAPIKEYEFAHWFRIPENNEHTTDKYTWRRLAFNEPGRDATLESTFQSRLAIDAAGTKAQLYSCLSTNTPANPLTVDIINY